MYGLEYFRQVAWKVFYLRQFVTRQSATFPVSVFIDILYATLEMQTSSSEFRVLYPSLNAA